MENPTMSVVGSIGVRIAFVIAIWALCFSGLEVRADLRFLLRESQGSVEEIAGTLARGSDGTLYAADASGRSSYGEVFAISPPAGPGQAWTKTLIHDFSSDTTGKAGYRPSGGVTLGPDGSIYGVAGNGGSGGYGVVFRLTPPRAKGLRWKYDLLHEFKPNARSSPSQGLLLGADGVLYGIAKPIDAEEDCGLAFSLAPRPRGERPWRYKIIAQFKRADGCLPSSGLTRDGEGNLYGSLVEPEDFSLNGAVYQLKLKASGAYRFVKLKAFVSGRDDVLQPRGGLVLEESGALIGAAGAGGNGCGGVFRLTPRAGAAVWRYQVLKRMFDVETQPCRPIAISAKGNQLAVLTSEGGANDVGALVILSPSANRPGRPYDAEIRETFSPAYGTPVGAPVFGSGDGIYGATNLKSSVWRSLP